MLPPAFCAMLRFTYSPAQDTVAVGYLMVNGACFCDVYTPRGEADALRGVG